MPDVLVLQPDEVFNVVVTDEVITVVLAEVLSDPVVSALVARVDLLEARLDALEP